uniref:Uncharacterized protein n=1 Tax=Ralstonia solanacearum TaxID=305 RepID=A0A0S4WXV4_RALSL|nr:protein of unknown function [Ralstonia solanacearum]
MKPPVSRPAFRHAVWILVAREVSIAALYCLVLTGQQMIQGAYLTAVRQPHDQPDDVGPPISRPRF